MPDARANIPSGHPRHLVCSAVLLLALAAGCGLFEPRTPEPPSGATVNYPPATESSVVLANFQTTIDRKDYTNYKQCFSDPAAGGRPYVFVPSVDAIVPYASVWAGWTRESEQTYFQNMIARSGPTAFSDVSLTIRDSLVTADSVIYNMEYVFTFEHQDPTFPKTAHGDLQFAVAPDSRRIWTIFRWSDYQIASSVTWSQFKGKFSN